MSKDTPEKKEARRILSEWARSKSPEERENLSRKWAESGTRLLITLRDLKRKREQK
jgi:hypothetical protein